MYVSIRTYRVGKGSIDDVMHRVDRDLAEAFAQEPGFIAYHVAPQGDRTVASMTLFQAREQADASNELAAEWVTDALADFDVERMGVMGGEVMVSRANAGLLEPAGRSPRGRARAAGSWQSDRHGRPSSRTAGVAPEARRPRPTPDDAFRLARHRWLAPARIDMGALADGSGSTA